MSRIVVISQVPPPVHGQTVMTRTLLRTLASLGHEVRLVDRRFSSTIDQVGRLQARKLVSVVGLVVRLARALLSVRPDAVVFFVTTRPGSFLVDWVLAETLRVARARVIVSVHSVGFRALAQRGTLWRLAVQRLLGAPFEVVTLGASLEPDVAPFADLGRRAVIPNTPGSIEACPRLGREERSVVFLSNLIAGKGAESFARIVRMLPHEDGAGWTATIAGPHGDPEIVSAVEETLRGTPDGVSARLVGAVSGDAKWSLLGRSTCLAFTSELVEAQPLTIAEAFALGTPVVAFRRGGIPDLVQDDVNGFLVEPGDEATFADRVVRVATDRALRDRLSRGARRTYEQRLSPNAYADAWQSVIGGAR